MADAGRAVTQDGSDRDKGSNEHGTSCPGKRWDKIVNELESSRFIFQGKRGNDQNQKMAKLRSIDKIWPVVLLCVFLVQVKSPV